MDPEIISNLTQLLLADPYLREEVMEKIVLAPGEILFHRGDPGDTLYLVRAGEIRIYTLDSQGQEITMNHIKAGECLGELAMVDAQPRSASAIAITDSELLRLSREDFLTQINRSPPLSECLMRLLSERIRYMTDYIERLGLWARLIANEDYTAISASLSELDLKGETVLMSVADCVRLMLKAIRDREQNLKESLQQLRIEIDRESLQKRLEEITDTDYFQSILEQSRKRRESRKPLSERGDQ